jgi:hypothetical protein
MRKAAVFLLAILLIVLPFHPFLTTFFAHIFSGNELALVFVKAWKEIFIMVISALVVLYWMFDEKRKPFDTLDYSIILFVCLSLIIGVLFTGDGFPQNIFQLMWGAKYGFLFLILFFFVRKIPIFDTERNDLINAALFSGSVVIVFGLLQASLLPEDFLVRFGYSPEYGNTTAGETLSYCHKIENTITHEEFCRVQSTLSGPNQLGAYTLVLMPFFFYRLFRAKTNLQMVLYSTPLFLGTIVLLLTWSRSAWIGAVVMAAVYFIIQARRSWVALLYLGIFALGVFAIFFPAINIDQWDDQKFTSLAWAGIALFALFLLLVANLYHRLFSQIGAFFFPTVLGLLISVRGYFDTFFWNIINRPSSTQGHWERWSDGIAYMVQNPLGLGLGDAGPASARFANPGETGFLPESWYLQVGLESGFLGLAFFITILILLGMTLLRAQTEFSRIVFLGLVAVSSAALFLHSWESAVVSFTFWTLAGVALAPQKYKHPLIKKIADKFEKFFSFHHHKS